MAEIALTLDEFEATECTAFQCIQPDGTYAYNNNQCTGTTMLTGVKCVVEEFEQTNLDLAMWFIGGNLTYVPEIYLAKHTWTVSGEDYKVYAVHTVDPITERKYGACPTTRTFGFLNIPCYGSADEIAGDVTEPIPSDWVTSWAESFAVASDSASSSTGGSGSSSSGSASTSPNSQSTDTSPPVSNGDDHKSTNAAVLGGAVGGGLVLLLVIVIVALIIAARKRKNSSEDPATPNGVEHVELVSPAAKPWDDHRPTVSTHPRSTVDESLPRSGATATVSEDSWSTDRGMRSTTQPSPYIAARPIQSASREAAGPIYYEPGERPFRSEGAPPAYEEVIRIGSRSFQAQELTAPLHVAQIRGLGAANALKVLTADPMVDHKRVQLDQVQIERQLPMTTLQTDSFVGWYNGKQVLLKKLAPDSIVNGPAVEDVAFEIQQRAHVGHRNLVHLVGVGWTSALDLGFLVEFHPLGSLRAYLDRNKESLSAWTPQKTEIAGGIARALEYLHRQQPPFIHHDICAKNVLLTDQMEAKLASCGSTETNPSVGAKRKSHQAFWMAPEVLNGDSYSPATDIYAFGVLLAELDTCETPYFDARSNSGQVMEVSEVLELVKNGRLRPSFTRECPQFIRELAMACCDQNPDTRLSAQQIVQLLKGE
ncbi:hypothetical protein DVH05_015448 [Phytophthora capsici]|nr:hypothetical protein DVH05_015448 [Phytophthora capsici]